MYLNGMTISMQLAQSSIPSVTTQAKREGNIVDTRQAATEQDKATLDVLSI